MRTRDPRVAYIAPQLNQAKDIAWTYLKHYTSNMWPCRVNESELWVELPGDIRIRLYGADNPIACAASISTRSCSTSSATWTPRSGPR